ncbi:hypothetical protein TM48_01435 [Mycobacterium shottsii]|uniref:Uncharacterized protein n=1 Tax=Mycobacterium shottsii TaxID=133549 RepID=A0A7I7LBS2_9MYCO|nr:hypothetical protein TM48_01435 [Mycobacterium shottsii]BBX56952.1 hypothetical protein MSHO_22970 [Mycobacterium shottsii]
MAGWVASVGSIAAFGALLVAVMEWRRGQSERRDQEADQARLVFLVPLDAGPRPEDGVIWQSGAIRISNRSESPVFDVEAAWANTKGESSIRQQVLPPHEHTKAVAVGDPQQMAESLTFVYTDVRGRRWVRIGSQQPRPCVANDLKAGPPPQSG